MTHRTVFLAIGALAVSLVACTGGADIDEPGPTSVPGFVQSHEREVVEEIGTLPFKHVMWDYKLTNAQIRRVTLGSQYFWIETHDNWIIALDRFEGKVVWKYWIWRDTPADWAPVEAAGVGETITALRKAQIKTRRAVEIHAKQTPIPDEEEWFAKLEELKTKRKEVDEQIIAAHVNDNIYFITRGWLYCLERTTGRELWYTKLDFTPSARPSATRAHLFIPSSDFSRVHWLSVEQKGRELFYSSNTLERHNQVFNRAIYDHPLVYHASRDGLLRTWYVDRVREHWSFESKEPWQADPYIHHLTRTEQVWRRDPDDPEERTKFNINRSYEICFIGGRDRTFYALDADGGLVLWQYALPAEVKSAADGIWNTENVYVKTVDGYLHAFDVVPQHKDAEGVPFGIVSRPQGPRWSIPRAEHLLMRSSRWVYLLGQEDVVLRVNEMTGEISGKYPLHTFAHTFINRMDAIFYVATMDGHFVALQEYKESQLFTPADRARLQKMREEAGEEED